jgi:hypothetical protein
MTRNYSLLSNASNYGDNILKEQNILFKFSLTITTYNILQRQSNSADVKQDDLKDLRTSILSSLIALEDWERNLML